MEIYALYVHYTKHCKMACEGEFECYRCDENWSEETYYLGSIGLETARKDFNPAKENDYSNVIEIDQCEVDLESGRVRKILPIEKIWRSLSGKWILMV